MTRLICLFFLKLEDIIKLKFPKQTNEMKMDDLHEGAIKAALENLIAYEKMNRTFVNLTPYHVLNLQAM